MEKRPFSPPTPLHKNGRFPPTLSWDTDEHGQTAVSDDGRRAADDGMNGGKRPFFSKFLSYMEGHKLTRSLFRVRPCSKTAVPARNGNKDLFALSKE